MRLTASRYVGDYLRVLSLLLNGVATHHRCCSSMLRTQSFVQMVPLWNTCPEPDWGVLFSAALLGDPPIRLLLLQIMQMSGTSLVSGCRKTMHTLQTQVSVFPNTVWVLGHTHPSTVVSVTFRSSTRKSSIQVSINGLSLRLFSNPAQSRIEMTPIYAKRHWENCALSQTGLCSGA